MLYNYQTGNPNQLWNPLWGRSMGPGMGPSPNIRGLNPTITPVGGIPENVLANPGDYRFNPSPRPPDPNMWANLTEGQSPENISKMWGELTSPWQITRSIQGGGAYQFPAMTYPTPGTNTTGGPVGGGATNWTPEYGGIPNVANPMLGEAGALFGNMANFPAISLLAGEINRGQQGQLLANYEQASPGIFSALGEGLTGIRSNIAGDISGGARAQMGIGAAERGLAGGQPGGTPMTNDMYLAALGKTSEAQSRLGQEQLMRYLAGLPVVQPYDVTREFVTGQQLTDAANMANLYASAPVPTAAAAEQQRMADLGMMRGINAQDWLAERNFGRSQQEQALNFQRSLQSMLLGGQLSEQEAARAWQRAMAYLQESKRGQSTGFRAPGIPYNYRGPRFGGSWLGPDMAPTFDAATGKLVSGGTPRTTPNQSPYKYDPITEQYYGYTGEDDMGNPINPQYYGGRRQSPGYGATTAQEQQAADMEAWLAGGQGPAPAPAVSASSPYSYRGIPDVIPGSPSGFVPPSSYSPQYGGNIPIPLDTTQYTDAVPRIGSAGADPERWSGLAVPNTFGPERPFGGLSPWDFSFGEYWNEAMGGPDKVLPYLLGLPGPE